MLEALNSIQKPSRGRCLLNLRERGAACGENRRFAQKGSRPRLERKRKEDRGTGTVPAGDGLAWCRGGQGQRFLYREGDNVYPYLISRRSSIKVRSNNNTYSRSRKTTLKICELTVLAVY